MMLKCAGCQEEKDEDKFHRNRSQSTGKDVYCKECRSSYYKNGRTWPDRKERNISLNKSGFKSCSLCKQRLALDRFYPIKNARYGDSAYCRDCNSKKSKEYFSRPDVKEKTKVYNSTPEAKIRKKKLESATPRYTLGRARSKALGRRPDPDNVSLDYLVTMFDNQEGLCIVSGIKMTWSAGDSGRKPTTISLDRIDNSKGYIPGNVRLVCWMVNAFKGTWTDEQMLTMARAIVKNTDAKSTEPSWQPHLVHSEAA